MGFESRGLGVAGCITPDCSQSAVISREPSARLLVDAGPGTGKTAVACARIAHLISVFDVNPARIWMISFTRTAVTEMRNRLAQHVGEHAYAIKIATVDAHAWAINSGYSQKATLTGSYEANIERVLELISIDDDAADYIGELEHLVVDEAQDLVGIRAELMEVLIAGLSPDCGVTVFADDAQAIYGFSEDEKVKEATGSCRLPLTRRLAAAGGFERCQLGEIHRTGSKTLRTIFSEVRATVLSIRESTGGLFEEIRNRVQSLADGSDLSATKLGIDALPEGTLVLFRRRAEALMASQFCEAPHSLRLSGFPASLPPWLSSCFSDLCSQRLGRQEFARRWRERVPNSPGYDEAEAWARLWRVAGESADSIDMHQLRRVLGRTSPPADFVSGEYGLPGPVVGTIHASKGREADDVLLLMPRGAEFEDDEDEQEETRVLFVGSTRARKTLKVGNAMAYAGGSLPSGRAYRAQTTKRGAGAMVEVGRTGDVTAACLAGRSTLSIEEAGKAQLWLRGHANCCSSLQLRQLGKEGSWNYLLADPQMDDMPISRLTRRVTDDFWEIANRARAKTGGKHRPPSTVRHVKVLGSRSVVLPPDDPELETLHEPWTASGFLLAPRLATFTKIYL